MSVFKPPKKPRKPLTSVIFGPFVFSPFPGLPALPPIELPASEESPGWRKRVKQWAQVLLDNPTMATDDPAAVAMLREADALDFLHFVTQSCLRVLIEESDKRSAIRLSSLIAWLGQIVGNLETRREGRHAESAARYGAHSAAQKREAAERQKQMNAYKLDLYENQGYFEVSTPELNAKVASKFGLSVDRVRKNTDSLKHKPRLCEVCEKPVWARGKTGPPPDRHPHCKNK